MDEDEIYEATRASIQATLDALGYGPEDTVELRIKTNKRGMIVGYYDDMDKLARRAARLSGQHNIYIVLNPVHNDLRARRFNRTEDWVKDAAKDEHVPCRRFTVIDCDPKRLTGVSATDAEHEAALALARQVREYLMGEMGFGDMFVADSGNGAHLVIPVDLPNDVATKNTLKDFLAALGERFDNDVVTLDRGVFNAAQPLKLWGTKAVKGENTPDRPHRASRLLHAPEKAA